MKVQNLNSKQFDAMKNNLTAHAGIFLIYSNAASDAQTALRLSGDEFTPKDGTQKEAFRVWKNVYILFRSVKETEKELRVDNDAIRSKLRAGTPAKVVFITEAGKIVESYDLTASVWKSVGLVPTKKDMELKGRDRKTAIHKAAEASFKAIGMRDLIPCDETETAPATGKAGKGSKADKAGKDEKPTEAVTGKAA